VGAPGRFSIKTASNAMADPHLLRVASDLIGNAWKLLPSALLRESKSVETNHNGPLPILSATTALDSTQPTPGKNFGAVPAIRPRRIHGTCVGLATVQRSMPPHGGKNMAEGAVEQGASFITCDSPPRRTWHMDAKLILLVERPSGRRGADLSA